MAADDTVFQVFDLDVAKVYLRCCICCNDHIRMLHAYVFKCFKRFHTFVSSVHLLPDAVNTYLDTHNIIRVREVQEGIRSLYADDASKYEKEHSKKLLVRRIYEMIPSQMENKKKRIVAQDIRGKEGDRFSQYQGRV